MEILDVSGILQIRSYLLFDNQLVIHASLNNAIHPNIGESGKCQGFDLTNKKNINNMQK